MSILFIIYDFLFIFGFLTYSLVHIFRKKINSLAFLQKLGFIGGIKINNSIWIQVVSVGEANLIENLVKRLKEFYDYPIVISTTTLTGNQIAKKKYSSFAKIVFFPIDVSFIVKKALRIIRPRIFIAVETEIWPNLFRFLSKNNVPIVIINGRISDKAFKRYKMIRPLMRKFLDKCCYIGVQNEFYKRRFQYLGASKEKVVVSGNMKFDGLKVDHQAIIEKKVNYTNWIKKENNLIFIAASTHHPEEELILDVYRDILRLEQKVNLIIAPRHPERVPSIEKVACDKGFIPVRMSQMPSSLKENTNVFIVDVIGELLSFYAFSDICFVGGSLTPCGGHNILEPIYFSKPTLFGPYMDNFKDIEQAVLEKEAGIRVNDSLQLKEALLKLSENTSYRAQLSSRCLEVFEKEKINLENNLQIIVKCLNFEPKIHE